MRSSLEDMKGVENQTGGGQGARRHPVQMRLTAAAERALAVHPTHPADRGTGRMDVANFLLNMARSDFFMSGEASKAQTLCSMCVYFPPNLPEGKYPREDWLELQKKSCSFDYVLGDADCLASRKTSCSLVDLGIPGSGGANG